MHFLPSPSWSIPQGRICACAPVLLFLTIPCLMFQSFQSCRTVWHTSLQDTQQQHFALPSSRSTEAHPHSTSPSQTPMCLMLLPSSDVGGMLCTACVLSGRCVHEQQHHCVLSFSHSEISGRGLGPITPRAVSSPRAQAISCHAEHGTLSDTEILPPVNMQTSIWG